MLKATGMVRRIDNLGRIVIPKEIRRKLGFDTNESFEIFVNDQEQVVLSKYRPGCIFCGDVESELIDNTCKSCIAGLYAKIK